MMARLRRPTVISTARLAREQDHGRAGAVTNDATPTTGCAANGRCTRPVVRDCPVPLCARHMREVYMYVHDVVTAELDRQATRLD